MPNFTVIMHEIQFRLGLCRFNPSWILMGRRRGEKCIDREERNWREGERWGEKGERKGRKEGRKVDVREMTARSWRFVWLKYNTVSHGADKWQEVSQDVVTAPQWWWRYHCMFTEHCSHSTSLLINADSGTTTVCTQGALLLIDTYHTAVLQLNF